MPRFVLLDHDHPTPHLDLMLEAEGTLLTWRLGAPPDHVQLAEPIGHHRLHYLDYEGPVSGNRGSVTRRDRGNMEWLEQGDDRIVVQLDGLSCRGRLELTRRDGATWAVRFEPAG